MVLARLQAQTHGRRAAMERAGARAQVSALRGGAGVDLERHLVHAFSTLCLVFV